MTYLRSYTPYQAELIEAAKARRARAEASATSVRAVLAAPIIIRPTSRAAPPSIPKRRVAKMREQAAAITETYCAAHQLLDEAVADLPESTVRPPAIEDIKRLVCRTYKVSKYDLVSARRSMDIVRPRMIAVWLCKKLTMRSYPYIGLRFGGRDHTTALHSVRRIQARYEGDSAFAAEMDGLLSALSSTDAKGSK